MAWSRPLPSRRPASEPASVASPRPGDRGRRARHHPAARPAGLACPSRHGRAGGGDRRLGAAHPPRDRAGGADRPG